MYQASGQFLAFVLMIVSISEGKWNTKIRTRHQKYIEMLICNIKYNII
jgi:hypothetical protein